VVTVSFHCIEYNSLDILLNTFIVRANNERISQLLFSLKALRSSFNTVIRKPHTAHIGACAFWRELGGEWGVDC